MILNTPQFLFMAIRFDILTIFPEAFESYFRFSILKRAQDKGFVKIKIHNLRKWSEDKHKTIDDRPYGGGAGMIFLVKPIFKAVQEIKRKYKIGKRRVILFSLRGKKLSQKDLERLSKYKHLILICPHYEGVDERVAKYIADEVISIGNYVLTGGELPAMVLIDGITRLIKGVIREDSLKEESFSKSLSFKEGGLYCEYPQYSRPEIFYPNPKNKKICWRVPKVLLSGDHKKILQWRKSKRLKVKDI